jgi:hypothetical protein
VLDLGRLGGCWLNKRIRRETFPFIMAILGCSIGGFRGADSDFR